MFNFKDIQVELGKKIEKNYLIEKQLGFNKSEIQTKTGIEKRYLANKLQNSETFAINSVKKIKKKNNLSKLTHIISVSNTPSILFPSIAHYVCSYLKLNKQVHCIGINSGCSGYVDALIIAYDILKVNKKSEILITTSDTYSKYINNLDRSIRPLFSDGGSATLLKYSKFGWKLESKFSSTISNTQENLIMKKDFYTKEIIIQMNGPEVLSFAIQYVIPQIQKLTKNEKSCMLLSHQAGKIVMDKIIKKLHSKIYIPTNYRKYGNLVSTSIPNLLFENFKKINKYKKIVLSGFGVGLTHTHIKLKK